ncbi:C2 calcium-dependent domain-containing protein 4A-like [Erinaceus europaeus]|uniref:C2 calcium-dependent domain-containing protein 4A-like n=1 Tax=Erinaceus europaeus TaxID=9365 RepID=A0ABM3W1C6_ERIEU|nr:C2 calcium-dependent domain-containing protein 4A-like [Erinaceus europaeus]
MWFLERLRLEPGLLPGRLRRAPATACANVLTPDRIPEFCIPPRLAPCPALAALRASEEQRAGGDDAGRTDWDPRSQAALSLPHLPRARTAYGFCALLESPHTRRKESLLLGGPRIPALPRPPAAPPRALRPGPDPGPGDAPRRPPRAPAAARRLLRAPEGLLSRARRAHRSLGLARGRSASGGDERADGSERAGGFGDEPPAGPLRAAAASSPARGRPRVRLLGTAAPAAQPRAPPASRAGSGLRPPGPARPRRPVGVPPRRQAASRRDGPSGAGAPGRGAGPPAGWGRAARTPDPPRLPPAAQ